PSDDVMRFPFILRGFTGVCSWQATFTLFLGFLQEKIMQNWQIVALAVVVVVLIAAAVWVVYNRNRSRHLRTHFGSEYDRTVREFGDRRSAETELSQREERVRKLQIRPLTVADRNRFGAACTGCRSLFRGDT